MTHLFFVSIWVHWGAAFSLEAWFRRTVLRVARPGHPKVPAWQLGVLQALFCLPYFWGGVAKLNRDWLLRAQPVTGWFSEREGFPYDHWAFPWFICWGESGATQRRERRWRRKADARCRTGGCAFDLTISFLLTHRDDRVRYGLGFPGAIFFNVSNKLMLNIGVFPYMMLISLALFIKPEHWELVVDAVVPTGPTPTAKEKGKGRGAGGGGPRHGLGREQKALLGSLAIFAAFEMLNPLRHFFYRSNVSWTEEGHIGAWHMKLRTKNGATVFQATTRAGDVYFLAPQVDPLLQTPGMRPKLKWIIQTRPWASLTYVAHLQRVFAAAGQELVKVQAHSCMALNYQARHHPLFIAEANLLDFIPRKVRGGRNPFAVLCSGTDPPPPSRRSTGTCSNPGWGASSRTSTPPPIATPAASRRSSSRPRPTLRRNYPRCTGRRATTARARSRSRATTWRCGTGASSSTPTRSLCPARERAGAGQCARMWMALLICVVLQYRLS